jgi:hypothetical protein
LLDANNQQPKRKMNTDNSKMPTPETIKAAEENYKWDEFSKWWAPRNNGRKPSRVDADAQDAYQYYCAGLLDEREKSAEIRMEESASQNWQETAEILGKQVAKFRLALDEIVNVRNIPHDDHEDVSVFDESNYRRAVAEAALTAEAPNIRS